MWNISFFLSAVLMGVGLATDAFSVSLANGLHEPNMTKKKTSLVAGVFAFFQCAMPMLGWIAVKTVVTKFASAEKLVPYIALVLLAFIGGKMIYEGVKGSEEESYKTGFASLIVQGVATSIDALSVGFAIESYVFSQALVYSLVIAAVTFLLCVIGVVIGKKFGTKFKGKATVFGGILLVLIGVEIFVKGVFF